MPDYTLEDPAFQIPPGTMFERIELDNIEATAATQVRVRLDRSVIDQYTEDLMNGAQMPPLHVFREKGSERNILADGFHRHRAAVNAKWGDIGCIVHEGTMHDALMYALGSNAEHGFRRTNADKRHAVEMALKDPELGNLRAQEIADICRVAKRTVEKMINEHMAADESDSQDANGSRDNRKKVKKNDGSDVRDSGIEPTQVDIETDELRKALKMVMVLPYPGEDALERLNVDADLIADCEYVSSWLANLVIAYRNGEEESKDE